MVSVLDVKNSGDWTMEKWSIQSKKDYAARHGMFILFVLLIRIGYELIVKT